MTQKLYLVTKQAERHEDHMPCGVYTFSKMKELFPSLITEDDFEPNVWLEVDVLNLEDFEFSTNEIERICSTEQSFNSYCEEDDEAIIAVNIILISVNEEMEST